MQPSDSLPPLATAPVPLAGGLPRCGRLFCASSGRRHVRPQRAVRRRRVAGSPPDRNMSRRGEGLPGVWAVLFVRAMVEHPAGDVPLLARFAQGSLLPSGSSAPWASGKTIGFGAAFPWPTRSRAYASPATFLRLSPGSLPAEAGSPLAGRVLHPLDDEQSFMKASPPPIPFDQSCLVALDFISHGTCLFDVRVVLLVLMKWTRPYTYCMSRRNFRGGIYLRLR